MKSKDKSVIIVGAGVGGLTTSIHLARRGYKVRILEKNAYVGGRCSAFNREGHRFDVGATMVMMTDIYKKTWESFGKNVFEELELQQLDPIYNINFHTGENIQFSSDLTKMQNELERIEPDSFNKFLRYMSDSYNVYKLSMKEIIDRNYYKATEFFNPKALLMLSRLKVFRNHYKHTTKFFKNDYLRILFTFQNIYVGQDPFKASAIFAMLPFLELTDGVWAPKGGMNRVSQNLLKIAEENGVEVIYNASVEKLKIENGRIVAAITKDDKEYIANLFVVNADVPFALNKFFPESKEAKRVNKLNYTCSVIMFHWGLDTTIPALEQHNVFVSNDYKASLKAIFDDKTIPEEPSFYIHAPARGDKTAAPENQDTLSAIVPLGHKEPGTAPDYETQKALARKTIVERFEKTGIQNFEKHIKFEVSYTPNTYDTLFNVTRGAVFGSLSHDIMQMGYMRPNNQHKKYKNLFFAGGSTHPGNGVPMVLLSAKHTTEKIEKYTKQLN